MESKYLLYKLYKRVDEKEFENAVTDEVLETIEKNYDTRPLNKLGHNKLI